MANAAHTMKTILLPFYDDDISRRAFELAARIAQPVGGYLEGLFVLRRPQMLDGGEGDMLADSHFAELENECHQAAARARVRFEACAAAQGLSISGAARASEASAGWREIEGMEEYVLGSHGRLFDLIVIGREFGRSWLNWRVLAESALFESGRPVLLAPDAPMMTCCENIVIAWNASTETARTVAFSMPLLARARGVTVLSVEGWGVPGPTGEELAGYLARTGIAATARTIVREGRSPAEAVLSECARTGADLLVKGAYTQSRLRQLIFGGATRHIIAHAQLPVILSN
jgi:nucleotide-binding universal stress UspA family protein